MTPDPRKVALIMALRNQGVRDMRVLEAIEKVPREVFVEQPFLDQAYADQPLPQFSSIRFRITACNIAIARWVLPAPATPWMKRGL